MTSRNTSGGRVAPLPLRALYTLPELQHAASLSRGRLLRLLDCLGVQLLHVGRVRLVPLAELKEKAWPFWESIQGAEMIRRVDDDD